VALSNLDANKYNKISIYRKNHPPCTSIPYSTIDIDKKSNTRISETGDVVVHAVQRPQKFLSEEEIQQIVTSYQNGKTTYELAEQYGCIRQTISRHLKKSGIQVTLTSTKIADNIPQIVALYDGGMKISEIARQFNVCEATIQKYLHIGGAKLRSRWEYE